MSLESAPNRLFDYPERIAALGTLSAVCQEFVRQIQPLGFRYYTFCAIPPMTMPYPTEFLVAHWPKPMLDAYLSRLSGERDPILRATAQIGKPFTTFALRRGEHGFRLKRNELEILDLALMHGVGMSYVVPIFRAQGYAGLASVLGEALEPSRSDQAKLRFLMEHTHDRLRELASPSFDTSKLSKREIQVLTQASRGSTDADIAHTLGISVRTVRFHFDNARKKLGARTRAEATATAVNSHFII